MKLLARTSSLSLLLLLQCTEPVLMTQTYQLPNRCEVEHCTPCTVAQNCEDGEICDKGICASPYCGDGELNGVEECDDGNDIATDACNDCHYPRCGDRAIQRGEECEVGLGGDKAWTDFTCDPDLCNRTAYVRCTKTSDCFADLSCVRGVCSPRADTTCQGASCDEVCPPIPDYEVSSVNDSSGKERCFLHCADNGHCPSGLLCAPDGFCVGKLEPDRPRTLSGPGPGTITREPGNVSTE